MNPHDIVCIKVTGEKVFLIAETDRRTWMVRRPQIADNGGIFHNTEEFFEVELEPVASYAARMVAEMKLKARSQKELYKDELAMTQEIEEEVAMATPKKTEPDPIN